MVFLLGRGDGGGADPPLRTQVGPRQTTKRKISARLRREIKKIKIAPEKIEALNFLDKLIQNNRFQKKFKLNQGDLIILNNNILAHGRTKFNLNSGDDQRTLIRAWVK